MVAIYKDLSDVERGFRQLKDVLAMRPIYHQIEARVKAHIFVATLALLVQRLLDRRLEEAGINFSAERAMEALQTVRLVTFRMDDRPERRGVSGGCPDARPGPEGIEVDGFEAADTPRGGGNRDVVTIRKIESCPPRGYVDGPQTWASLAVKRLPRLLSVVRHLGNVAVSAAEDDKGAGDPLRDCGHGAPSIDANRG